MNPKGEASEGAETLLKEVREDPYGWHWLDLDKLLDLWGFAAEIIKDTKGGEATFRYHMERPELNVVLYHVDRVHSTVAQLAVRLIDRVRNAK